MWTFLRYTPNQRLRNLASVLFKELGTMLATVKWTIWEWYTALIITLNIHWFIKIIICNRLCTKLSDTIQCLQHEVEQWKIPTLIHWRKEQKHLALCLSSHRRSTSFFLFCTIPSTNSLDEYYLTHRADVTRHCFNLKKKVSSTCYFCSLLSWSLKDSSQQRVMVTWEQCMLTGP